MNQKILVAEDELIVAFDLCDTVAEAGYEVDGPHAGISSAMLACQKERPAAAILDIQLDDGAVYPLAQKLAEENIPIIFHSGRHTREEIAEHFPKATTLLKPCPPTDLIDAVNAAFENA